jgi:hypothetical protein
LNTVTQIVEPVSVFGWQHFAPFALAFFGAIVGGAVTHILTRSRDVKNKKRELIVRNLIEAYEAFDSSTLREPREEMLAVETAVAKLQLFGDQKLIELTQEFCAAMHKSGNHNTDKLMKEIRRQIRIELELPMTNSNFSILRYTELKD